MVCAQIWSTLLLYNLPASQFRGWYEIHAHFQYVVLWEWMYTVESHPVANIENTTGMNIHKRWREVGWPDEGSRVSQQWELAGAPTLFVPDWRLEVVQAHARTCYNQNSSQTAEKDSSLDLRKNILKGYQANTRNVHLCFIPNQADFSVIMVSCLQEKDVKTALIFKLNQVGYTSDRVL